MTDPTSLHRRAERLLAARDPVMDRLIAVVGPCRLRPHPDPFDCLVRAIISQQISTRAAETIHARLLEGLGPGGVTAASVLAAKESALRGAGLSVSKTKSLRDLAAHVDRGAIPLDRLGAMDDEEVIGTLTPVHGIGRWTAEMFLIFVLCRPDVLPVDDFGLKAGVKRQYGLAGMPGRQLLHEYAGPWRPYRSIATWYIWRGQEIASTVRSDGIPQ
jgi:DNA-3-methyladenine glycosylase II